MQLNIHDRTKDTLQQYALQIRHIRPNVKLVTNKIGGKLVEFVPATKGGVTCIAVILKDCVLPRIFMSRTHPNDHFNRKLGTFWAVVELVRTTFGNNYGITDYYFEDNGKTLNVIIEVAKDTTAATNYNDVLAATL